MKHKIKQINDYAVVISDDEIKINDFITDNYKVWKWKDNCSLLGRKKVIVTIAPYFIEGLPMLELPNQEEDVENFDELFLMNRNDLRVLFNAGNAGSGGALYNRVRKYNGFDEFRESNEGGEFLIDKLHKAAQKQYSEEDIRKAVLKGRIRLNSISPKYSIEEIIQSLQKEQFPIAVELEAEQEYTDGVTDDGRIRRFYGKTNLQIIKWYYE